MRFRVMEGTHVCDDPSGKKDAKGNPVEVTFNKGDEFESDTDLVGRLGNKFARVDNLGKGRLGNAPGSEGPITQAEIRRRGMSDDAAKAAEQGFNTAFGDTGRTPPKPVKPSEAEMTKVWESMTVEELKAEAAKDGIELHGARSKADIIDAIKTAYEDSE